MCQLAVPMLLPCGNSTEYLTWHLQTISRKWQNKGDKTFTVGNMVDTRCPIVSFSRIGPFSKNKAKLLNMICGNTKMDSQFFWHEDLAGGNLQKEISNGLVEVLWYLPSNKGSDKFSKQTLFANLRGDALDSPRESHFLANASNVNCIMVERLPSPTVDYLKCLVSANTILIVLYDAMEEDSIRKGVLQLTTETKLSEERILYEPNNINTSEFIDHMQKWIDRMIDNKTSVSVSRSVPECSVYSQLDRSLSSLEQEAEMFGFCNMKKGEKYLHALQHAEAILETMGSKDSIKVKRDILPRQGSTWASWSKQDKEYYRMERRGTVRVDKYAADLEKEKANLRLQQLAFPIAPEVQLFINCLIWFDKETRKYFLQILKLKLDMKSVVNLSTLREKYKKVHEEGTSEQREHRLRQIAQDITNSSLGLEHLFREIGQIYESLTNAIQELDTVHRNTDCLGKLSDMMSDLLVEGYPIEIIDGDAAYVAMTWMKAILSSLGQKLRPLNAKIFTLSVLGVQSTGKSTLLNAMFGLQFAVSSGRCTRGGFLQLVPIDQVWRQKFGCDYLFILDTEGLKAPEFSGADANNQHDNELATLVIGLSNMTMINVAMESTAEMQDVLQISVHAFLRMNAVGRKQGCHFVHQNVAAIDAVESNMHGRDKTLKELDAMTCHAAKLEKKDAQYKRFQDILDYDPSRDNTYVPGLWQGNPPMAPPNQGYSDKVISIRATILSFIKLIQTHGMGSNLVTVKDFGTKFEDLWKAMKHENFVFSFKNSIEIEAYSKLKDRFNNLVWDMRVAVSTQLKDQLNSEMRECPLEDLHSRREKIRRDIKFYIDNQVRQLKTDLQDYFEKAENKSYIENYRRRFLGTEIETLERDLHIDSETTIDEESALCKATDELRRLQREGDQIIQKTLQDNIRANKDRYLKYSRHLQNIQSTSNSTEEVLKQLPNKIQHELRDQFEVMWDVATFQVKDLQFHGRRLDIEQDVYDSLEKNCYADGNIIRNLLGRQGLRAVEKNSNLNINETDIESKRIRIAAIIPGRAASGGGVLGKMKTKLSTQAGLEESDIYQAIQQSHTIYKTAQHFLERCRPKIYENIQSHRFFHFVLNEIKSLDRNSTFEFGRRFVVKVAIKCAALAVKVFQAMQEEYINREDPSTKLKELKEEFWRMFIARVLEANPTESFCKDFLLKLLKENVKNRLDCAELANNVKTEQSSVYGSHKHLQLQVLLDMGKHDKFENYISYIQHYEHFILSWIKGNVQKHLQTPYIDSGHSKFVELVGERMCEIKTKISRALETTMNERHHDFESFLDSLVKHFRNVGGLVVSDLEVQRVKGMLNVENLDYFLSVAKDMFQSLVSDCIEKTNEWDLRDHLMQIDKPVEEYLFKFVIGCNATCPFCRALCDAHAANKSGDHMTTLHQPQGLGSYRHDGGPLDGHLCIELCSSDVGPESQTTFKNKDTNFERKLFREYKDIYPEWSIMYEPNPTSLKYWKWVFARFQQEFTKHYVAKEAVNIPREWKDYTWEDIRKNLEEIYSINIVEDID